jgi:hypothetical protein
VLRNFQTSAAIYPALRGRGKRMRQHLLQHLSPRAASRLTSSHLTALDGLSWKQNTSTNLSSTNLSAIKLFAINTSFIIAASRELGMVLQE